MVNILINGIEDIIEHIENGKRILCFGAGKCFDDFFSTHSSLDPYIDAVIDNNKALIGTFKIHKEKQIKVISVYEAENLCFSNKYVILITMYNYCFDVVRQMDTLKGFNDIEVFIVPLLLSRATKLKEIKKNKVQNVIPKKIHYCWFGNGEISKDLRSYMASWEKYCPDYEICRWDETNFDISVNSYVSQAYERKQWAFVADYVKLKTIYDNGGIFLDCDVELIRSLDDLLGNDMFCGFEDETFVNFGLGYGAKKGHEFLGALIKEYDEKQFVLENGELDFTPCPIYQTELLKRYGMEDKNKFQELDRITVYPRDCFAPYSLEGMGAITENTYSIHHYKGSWLTGNLRKDIERKKYLFRQVKDHIYTYSLLINGNE